jgi:hypothetical protein
MTSAASPLAVTSERKIPRSREQQLSELLGDDLLGALRLARRTAVFHCPVTHRKCAAMPETIEKEFVASCFDGRRRRARPDLARGVTDALAWAWHRTQGRPLPIREQAAG